MRSFPFMLALAAALLAAHEAPAAPVIVGGQETERDWPFMAYVDQGRQEIELGDNQFCAASLIAPTWAVTAAHCTTLAEVDPVVTTLVFSRRVKSDTDAGERVQVKRVVVHESWGDTAHGNDIALLELERAPAAATPVKIAGAAEAGLWAPGAMMTILGWGGTSDGGSGSDALKEAQVPVVSDADCARLEADFEAPTMVCAGYLAGGTDTCQGDSGGPMVTQAADGSWRQVGITSWGDGCAQPDHPGVYSRIAGAELRDWVAKLVPEAISTASATPAPAPPAAAPAPAATPAPSQPASAPAPKAKAPVKKKAKKPKSCKRYKSRSARKRCVKRRAAAKRRAAKRS